MYGDLYDWFQNHKDPENVFNAPKINYNAFFQTDLGQTLKNIRVEKVHVVGVTTDMCGYLYQ